MSASVMSALGWTLVHFLWEGAALALLLMLFGRVAARVRYAAACAILAAMPLAFAATLYRMWPADVTMANFRIPLGQGIVAPLGSGSPQWSAGAGTLWTWLVVAWMSGVAIFYLRSLGGWLAARRLRHTGVAPASAEWQERFHDLRARVGVDRAVALMESCLSEVPVVIGYFRPVILLPAGLATGLSTDQVEALLMHELAHIRRHDYLVNLLQSAIEGLLFYHPAVWWVSHVIRTEREHCCDDAVVALRGDVRGYAGALAALESLRAPELLLAATGGSLVRRVRRLLQQPEGPQGSPATVIAAAVLLVSAATMLSGWQQDSPQPQRPAPPRAPVAQQKQAQGRQPARAPLDNPYDKWVKQDVVYIIAPEERAAFENLGSNEEKEHFIEQFWQRRDPTPGTVENEFKEEHYRRIAYSNRQYQDGNGLAGWKTDQGRVYITYGPPDEKEVHPTGNPPYEQWLYRHIEGIGENVVIEFREEGGRMRMTRDPAAKVPRALLVIPDGVLVRAPAGVTNVQPSLYAQVDAFVRRVVTTFEDAVQGKLWNRPAKAAPGGQGLYLVTMRSPAGGVIVRQAQFVTIVQAGPAR
jgi:GWxTD domain-containing protein